MSRFRRIVLKLNRRRLCLVSRIIFLDLDCTFSKLVSGVILRLWEYATRADEVSVDLAKDQTRTRQDISDPCYTDLSTSSLPNASSWINSSSSWCRARILSPISLLNNLA